MCDPERVRSSAVRDDAHWGALYLALAAIGTTWLAAEVVAPTGFWRATARVVFATLAVATMMVWVRVEAVALDQAEWCSCASSTVTMRIVQSRPWPDRQPFVEDRIPSLAMTIDETESQEVEHAGVQ